MKENKIDDKLAIEFIQDKLLINLEKLDKENENLKKEISRSNAITKMASMYIKSCNLKIALEKINEKK